MKLIEVLGTIQLFSPSDCGPLHHRDLCDAMGSARCPLKLPLDRAVLLCETCVMAEHATLAEEIWLAIKTTNSSDQ